MTDSDVKKKSTRLRPLAITLFLGVIIALSWAAVEVAHFLPGSFAQLASLSSKLDTFARNQEDLLVVSETDEVLQSGGVVEIEIVNNDPRTNEAGKHIFSYDCVDGVAIDLLVEDGYQSLDCQTAYEVQSGTPLKFVIDSVKDYESHVRYGVLYFAENETEPMLVASSSITVVNESLAAEDQLALGDDENPTNETAVVPVETESTPVEETEPVENEVTTAPVFTPATQTPTPVVAGVNTFVPISDPLGRTDLSTRFLSSGTIVGDMFFPGDIVQHERGAVQFEVINLGSKTSGDWTYTVTLPNGVTYTSETQKPLKPQEAATLTIGFGTDDDPTHTVRVHISADTDENALNDRFERVIAFYQ